MRPKLMHVVLMGPKKAGKTAFLRTLAGHSQKAATMENVEEEEYSPTLEDDTFHIQMNNGNISDEARQSRELILFYDTAGIADFGNVDMKKAYLQVADAFLLFYSTVDSDSFNRMDTLKKQLDKERLAGSKEKREIPIIVIGTKVDLTGRKVDSEFALHWANRERVKLFDASARDRDSVVDVVHYLYGRFFNREAKFSLSRRLKPEKSNSQILMDF